MKRRRKSKSESSYPMTKGAIIVFCVMLIFRPLYNEFQYLWVTTALTTQSKHHWAYWFATSQRVKEIEAMIYQGLPDDWDGAFIPIFAAPEPEEVVEEVVEEIVVEVEPEEPLIELPEVIEIDPYLEMDFDILDDGLYIKSVSGTGYVGHLIVVTDPKRVKVGLTDRLGRYGDKVVNMVEKAGGVAGLNGGWFEDGPNYDSTGGVPTGYIIQGGEVTSKRNTGKVEMVGLDALGNLYVGKYSMNEALSLGILEAMSTSPTLILNGEGLITKGDGGWGVAPRSAIGQDKHGAIFLLAIDGRQVHSVGASLRVVQDIFLEHKVVTAIGLDGGSSTVMCYDGEFVNKPALGRERSIPTCWVVMPNIDE